MRALFLCISCLVVLLPSLAALASAQGACPTVNNYFPRVGYPGYGLTIEGDNLQGITAVKFANNISASFLTISASEIFVLIPLGASSGPIAVSKPNCPDALTDVFTVPAPPTLALTPASQTLAVGAVAPITLNFDTGLFTSAIITLETSNPAAASVPPFLVALPGTSVLTFDVAGLAAGATVTITATLPPNLGGASATATVNVISGATHFVSLAGGIGGRAGGALGVPIEIEALGDEQSIQFSLSFNPAVLGEPAAIPGMSLGYDAVLTTDITQIAQGRLGLTLKFPPGQPLPPGHKQIVFVRFQIAADAPAGSTPFGFGDLPVARQITSPGGQTLPAIFTPGSGMIER
jgi:hypothetical protein